VSARESSTNGWHRCGGTVIASQSTVLNAIKKTLALRVSVHERTATCARNAAAPSPISTLRRERMAEPAGCEARSGRPDFPGRRRDFHRGGNSILHPLHPEGGRDYLVPSRRVCGGEWFRPAPSPQTVQAAADGWRTGALLPGWRAAPRRKDLRADRQPEVSPSSTIEVRLFWKQEEDP